MVLCLVSKSQAQKVKSIVAEKWRIIQQTDRGREFWAGLLPGLFCPKLNKLDQTSKGRVELCMG